MRALELIGAAVVIGLLAFAVDYLIKNLKLKGKRNDIHRSRQARVAAAAGRNEDGHQGGGGGSDRPRRTDDATG